MASNYGAAAAALLALCFINTAPAFAATPTPADKARGPAKTPAPATAPRTDLLTPTDQVRGTANEITTILKNPALERAYIEQIESYTNERFIYGKETIDSDFAEVQSRIVTAKGEEYMLNYRLRQAGKEWKIYDVVVENISLVNNYRSQFNRIISNQSYDELIRRLRDKQIQTAVEKH